MFSQVHIYLIKATKCLRNKLGKILLDLNVHHFEVEL